MADWIRRVRQALGTFHRLFPRPCVYLRALSVSAWSHRRTGGAQAGVLLRDGGRVPPQTRFALQHPRAAWPKALLAARLLLRAGRCLAAAGGRQQSQGHVSALTSRSRGGPGGSLLSGGGRNLLRFCYAKTDADLEEACRRLSRLSITPNV